VSGSNGAYLRWKGRLKVEIDYLLIEDLMTDDQR